MRPIIFRGKRVDTGKWVEGFYRKTSFYNKLGDEPILIYEKHFIGKLDNIECFDGIFEQVEVVPETVGQFTGISDKNNIDIFEGDVCRVTYYNHSSPNTNIIQEVIFERGIFVLKASSSNACGLELEDSRLYVPFYYSEAPNSIEVIGNIHDNKDLLKG